MIKYACITSMNQEYYDKCGRACIESFRHFWPDDVTLYVYNEDMHKPKKRKGVEYIDWSELGPDYVSFVERSKNSKIIQFSKKAFPIIHALENIKCDRLIWIDADVSTKAPVHPQLLEVISPNDVLSSHFGVRHEWPSDSDPGRMSFSCETGFFIINKNNSFAERMAARYREYYISDLGYSLRRFYDGEVYGAVVGEMEVLGAKMLEMNPNQKHKTPIPRSMLAPYIQHFKAGVKDSLTNESILASIDFDQQIDED